MYTASTDQKKRKQECIAEKWVKEREKKYRKEMTELQGGKWQIFHEENLLSLPVELGPKHRSRHFFS